MTKAASIAALVVAGCSPGLTVNPETQIVCSTSADCPDGWVCLAGVSLCTLDVDNESPMVEGADATSPQSVEVVFTEAVAPALAADRANYQVDGDLEVTEAFLLQGGLRVLLETDFQTPGTTHTLRVFNVTDLAGNPLVDPAAASFTGFGGMPETAPPTPVSPLEGARILGLSTQLVWTSRLGARYYDIEVSTDSSFSASIAGRVDAPETVYDVTVTDPATHYWRVRSNIPPMSWSPTRTFNPIGNGLYVYCAQGEVCDDGPVSQLPPGNRTLPFKSLPVAHSMAIMLGVDDLHIAARGGTDGYPGSFGTGGLNLLGGYDPSFVDRQPQARPTILRGEGFLLNVFGGSRPQLIDGLHIEAQGANSLAMRVTDADRDLTLSNLHIRAGGTGARQAAGIFVDSSPGAGPQILDNVFEVDAATAFAISVEQGAPLIRGCTIRATGNSPVGGVVFGVVVDANVVAPQIGSIELLDNRIEVSSTGLTGTFGITALFADAIIAANNVVAVTPGAGNGWGFSLGSVTEAHLIHNTIVLGPAPMGAFGRGIVQEDAHVSLTNNLIVGAGATSVCISEETTTSDPKSVRNNALVNCGVAYLNEQGDCYIETMCMSLMPANVIDAATFPATLDMESVQNGVCSTCESSRVLGNIAGAMAQADLFADHDGADDDPATLGDNDYTLSLSADPLGLANAGFNTTIATGCGTYETPVSCGDVTTDHDGAPRSATPDIGAYELP